MIVSNASPLIYLGKVGGILNEMLIAGFYLSSEIMLRFIESL